MRRPRLLGGFRDEEQQQQRLLGRVTQTLNRLEREVTGYREALDALPVGVVIRDDAGVEIYRNRRASSPTGELQADVLVGRALETLLARVPGGGPAHETLDLRGPPARSVELTVAPLVSGGSIGLIEDVSERYQLDSVRRDFVANVNHELRTPVGAMGLLAEALEAETDPEVVRRLVGRISAEAERAHELIEDLLDLSRIETGDRPEPEPVPVADVVARAVARVQAAQERCGVEVSVARVTDAVIDGTREDLVSALANLLDNAVKYSERGSTVEVSALEVGAMVEFVVRDEGIGIATRELDRIFERFYRVDRARDRRTGGSGLGLAIVRHVANNHAGDVLVQSAEGEGSTFTMRVRAAS